MKLGEIGCTKGIWWVLQASSGNQEKVSCNSVAEAVQSLSVSVSRAELLDKPFQLLTAEEWGLLRKYQPTSDSRELVSV